MTNLSSRILAAERVRGIAPADGNSNNCNGRVGIDDWNGPLAFVLTLQNNDRQDVKVRVFRRDSEPEPEPWNAIIVSANSRMRLWARGRNRWREKDAFPALYYWLRDCWESELRTAGYTLALIPEIQQLRTEGLAYLLEEMRFETHECWKNHELRLKGYGMFQSGDRADLPPEERAENYRKECLGTRTRSEQKSGASEGPELSPEQSYERLEAVTLRVRIRLTRRALGETGMISEPNNLNYLREQDAALQARLKQRELLERSRS